jgi:hypothetical protein
VTDAVNSATHHVLLVGVDAYPNHPLAGCVNDIDAIQRMLLSDRMGLAPDRIRRLASPHRLDAHATEVAEQPATLDNLREALGELASDRVDRDHRVFIYFAGHGTRVPFAQGGALFHREALVPADCDLKASELRVLYDFELNELLRAIVRRTRQVSIVLDCCHAAGATRDALDPADWTSRCIDLSQRGAGPVLRGDGAQASAASTDLGSVEDCHVVAACLSHERAQEGSGRDGVRGGLLTHALVSALDAATDAELPTMTWGRIWHAVRAGVQLRNSAQHPSMIGHAARAVFGGPPTEGDAGIPIVRVTVGYQIAAGELSRVTRGAMVAVYADVPPYFPRLDSAEDHRQRLGVLRVTETRRDAAPAKPVGPAFALPYGARGRVIQAGEAARLRCAVLPRDPSLEGQLAASPLLELATVPVRPEVWLEHSNGQWFVTDSVHGIGTDADRPVLFALQRAELDCARDILEHYYRYSQPLHMAELATDLPGQLDLRVLSCGDQPLSAGDAQAAALPEAPSRAERSYAVPTGGRVCFQVRNSSPRRLRVTLLNSAASGKVQLLGDEIVDARHAHVFWAGSSLGMPFVMTPPRGASRCIDRLVAIGRTAVSHDLSYLRVDRTFAEIVQRSRSAGRGMDDGSQDNRSRPEEWAAAQALIETGVRLA